jgi:hypothetical protein
VISDDLPALPASMVGEEIEIFIRYRGQEYSAGGGLVREVNIQNDVAVRPSWEPYAQWETTGIKTISITMDTRRR